MSGAGPRSGESGERAEIYAGAGFAEEGPVGPGGTLYPRRRASSTGAWVSTFHDWPKPTMAKAMSRAWRGKSRMVRKPRKSGPRPLPPNRVFGATNPEELR